MSLDELKYVAVLAGSIPVGIFLKQTGTLVRGLGATLFGFSLVFATCGFHTLHSLVTIIGTWIITRFITKHCYNLTLLWTFAYLLFFRLQTFLNLPPPSPFANAVQLLLTLKMVSLAAELQRSYVASISRQVEQTGPMRRNVVLGLIPSLKDMLCYSYCYVGIMTGPFYRYKTYQDWVYETDLNRIPSLRPMLERLRLGPLYGVAFLLVSRLCPLDYVKTAAFADHSVLYRLFYTSLIFLVFRLRFYVAWTFAECACMSAAFGAYPVGAKARPGNGPTQQYYTSGKETVEYDFETMKNIDPHNTDFCTSVKDGMKYWNMTVQWWLANYIYRRSPFKARILRIGWTMLVSAYWHGIHPGYYLSFLTIPLCLAAEGAMDVGLRQRLGVTGCRLYDWVHWFLKMRAYDYMCMGFVLLTYQDTLAFWRLMHYYIHSLALGLFLLGYTLSLLRGEAGTSRASGLSSSMLAESKEAVTSSGQAAPAGPQRPVMRLPDLPAEVRRRAAQASEPSGGVSAGTPPPSPPSAQGPPSDLSNKQ